MFASDCALAIGAYSSMYAACSAVKLMANGCGVAGALFGFTFLYSLQPVAFDIK